MSIFSRKEAPSANSKIEPTHKLKANNQELHVKFNQDQVKAADKHNSVELDNDQHYRCSCCTMEFNRPSDLQRHLLIHSKTKPYMCNICDRGFTWFGNFQKHMFTHGAGQTSLHPLLIHQMNEDEFVMKDGSLFKCRLCLKLFTRMSGLRTHVRMHTGQRPYKCDQCSFAFTTARALKMHLRIHTGM